jgi:hypothetical protein
MGQKIHDWLEFFTIFFFLSMTHDDPTSLKEVKEVEKKKWMESDGKIKGKKIKIVVKKSHIEYQV